MVPTAGGCSISKIIIRNIVITTDNENHNALKKTNSIKGNTAKHTPTKKPKKCPANICFESEDLLLGIANKIKADEPILAIKTGYFGSKIEMRNKIIPA